MRSTPNHHIFSSACHVVLPVFTASVYSVSNPFTLC